LLDGTPPDEPLFALNNPDPAGDDRQADQQLRQRQGSWCQTDCKQRVRRAHSFAG